MRLAGIDDALTLGVGQDAARQQARRQLRAVSGTRRRDRGHSSRLHQPGRMRLRARNVDRLQRVAFIEACGETRGWVRAPVTRFVGEFGDVRHWRRPFDEIELRHRCFRPRGDRRARWKNGRGGQGSGPGDRRARRHQAEDPAEQFGGGDGHAGRGRKAARILGRNAVDHRQARVDRGAVARIGLAGERCREDNAAFLLHPHEAVAPGRLVGTDIAAGDGDKASAVGKTRKRRSDMPDRGFGEAALDMRRCREGRIHQNDARPDGGIEPVMNLLGVVPCDRQHIAKEAAEQPGARVGNLVQRKPRFGELSEYRQQPRAGRRFQNKIGCGQCGRFRGGKAERDRRRELLQALGFLGPARLRRQPLGKAREHVEHRGGRARAHASRRRICARTAPAPPRARRRRPSTPTRLRRPKRRTRLPWRNAGRGCRAHGLGPAVAPARSRHEQVPTPCRAGPGAGTAEAWPQRVLQRIRMSACGRSPGEKEWASPAVALFAVRIHPLPGRPLPLGTVGKGAVEMKKARGGGPSVRQCCDDTAGTAPLGKTGKYDAAGELVRAMQHVERREIVHAADVVAAVAATAEQDAGVRAHA